MRKNLKKRLAVVLTAALAFSTPVAVNPTVAGAEAEESEVLGFYDMSSEDGIEIVTGTGKSAATVAGGVLTIPYTKSYQANKITLDADLTKVSEGVSVSFKTKAASSTDGYSPLVTFAWENNGFASLLASLEFGGNSSGTWIDPTWDADGDESTTNDNIILRVNKTDYDNIVLTIDGSAVKVYKNGELYSTDTEFGGGDSASLLGLIKNGTCKLRLGSWPCDWWKFNDYAGTFDDVAVYSKALTAAEVSEMYAEENPDPTEEPTATPTEGTETAAPTQGTETAEPTQGTETAEPTQGTETTEPTQGTETAEPTQGTETTEPTQGTETAEPTQGTETTEPTQGTETTEPTQGTETTEPTQGTETAEPTQGTETEAPTADPSIKQTVSDPAFFYDFEGDTPLANKGTISAENAVIAGAGTIADGCFNNAVGEDAPMRENYLSLPADLLKKIRETESNALTISFKVKGDSSSTYSRWSALFTIARPGSAGDGAGGVTTDPNTWPCFGIYLRGGAYLNCWGIIDASENAPGSENNGTAAYMLDNEWHTITVTATPNTLKYYIDGVAYQESESAIANKLFSDENDSTGLAEDVAISLGGNQLFAWTDPDVPAYFDDFAMFDKELTEEEIAALVSGNYEFETVGKTETPGPSADPSAEPSADPSAEPSADPSAEPSADPSAEPSADPSASPSTEPTQKPDGGEQTTASLTLDKASATLYTGKVSNSVTVKPTVKGASQTVTWTTSNAKVATVDSKGVITAVAAGTATITAKANGIIKTVSVTVKNPTISVKKGKKAAKKVTVKKKKSVTLKVSVTPSGSGMSLAKLSKKAKKIVKATLKGGKLKIKGKKKGSVTLKIKSGKATKKVKVKVK